MLELDKIHCGDNCDLLGQLPRECIDLVVTSPPYDDLRTYGGHSWDFFGVAWQLKRVLKPGGVIVWVVADATKDGSETGSSMEQALHFKRLGLNLHDTMIYEKSKAHVFDPRQHRYKHTAEFMFVVSKGKPRVFNPIMDLPVLNSGAVRKVRQRLPDGSIRSDRTVTLGDWQARGAVWVYEGGVGHSTKDAIAFEHPAIYPDALARDHVATWSNAGDLVLDPFSGSGTTAKAAKELGRRFLGLEINPEYCAIAERRLAQQVLTFSDGMTEEDDRRFNRAWDANNEAV